MRYLNIILISNLLLGCADNQIVLVPDTEGKVGVVAVVNEGGTTKLTSANESIDIDNPKKEHKETKVLTEAEIESTYGDTLSHQPNPPVRFNILFDSGSSDISDAGKDIITEIIQTIKEKNSCDISSIGNSDTTGSNAQNEGISTQRADNVKKALVEQGIKSECIDTRYYGENDLFVKTPDETPEPKNRRVEVEIR